MKPTHYVGVFDGMDLHAIVKVSEDLYVRRTFRIVASYCTLELVPVNKPESCFSTPAKKANPHEFDDAVTDYKESYVEALG